MAPQGDDPGSRHEGQQTLLAILLSLAGGTVVVIVTWLVSLTLREVEVVGALVMFAVGLGLDVRAGVHVKLRYLHWPGKRGQRWSRSRRRRLFWLTVVEGALALSLTIAGLHFFSHPGGIVQLATVLVLLIAVAVGIEKTRKMIREPGGPRPGSDAIEQCRPVRAILNPERAWNGKWGLDTIFRLVTDRAPIGHRSKAAVLLIVGLCFALLTQAGAVVGHLATQGRHSGDGAIETGRRGNDGGTKSEGEGSDEGGSTSSRERTYEDNCGREIVPGDGAPKLLRGELHDAWYALSPADGCALRAARIAGGLAYMVEGQCRGRFWSIGIGSWDHPAAVLIEYAALAAREIQRHQLLLGASRRVDLVEGDFHLVYTPLGPFLLIRKQKTDGYGGPNKKPESCTEIERGGEKYEVLSPGMAELWIRFSEESGVPAWPSVDSSESRESFVLRDASGNELASGYCVSPARCELDSEGVHMTSSSPEIESVTVGRIVEHFPG